jgi:hypothetical protein
MKSWVLAAGLLAAAFVPAASAADLGYDDGPPPYAEQRYRVPPQAYDDDDVPPQPRRYTGPAHGRVCARSDEVRARLDDMGWRDFHGGHEQGPMVVLRARRPSGRLFELSLDRCSGEIMEARPLEARPLGPFAYNRPRPFYDGPRYERWNDDFYGPRGPNRWRRDY